MTLLGHPKASTDQVEITASSLLGRITTISKAESEDNISAASPRHRMRNGTC